MNRHEHKECEHELDYCKICRRPHCKLCGKEWYEYVYYPYYLSTGNGWQNPNWIYSHSGQSFDVPMNDIKVTYTAHNHAKSS